jgi:tRNA(Ile)-lysidine synthase
MNIHNSIKQFIKKHALIKRNDKIVVGLSGGPDSVFLLHFLVELRKEIPITLIVAHLNHEWRAEAAQEELLCREIARTFDLQYISAKMSELSLPFKLGGSKEEYARKARRYFFEKIAQEHNATGIALAHHLQDQEETFFIRLIRGSSLTGLTAMRPRNGLYIRPLLETNKNDIVTWLDAHNITYATDISNISQEYLRNRIRSKVLPALRECDERFEANFLSTLHRLTATENFLEKFTATTFAAITSQKNDTYILNITDFLALDPVLQHRVLLYWLITEKVPFPITQAFLDEIIRFFKNPRGGTHIIHEQWRIIKKQNEASLVKI